MAICQYLGELSRDIDLSRLDGITIAFDYHQALANLDRGFETNRELTATTGEAVGVAMTPAIMREGLIKSHIVLNVEYIFQMILPDHEYHPHAIHTLAHEAAHVAVTAAFDKCFPGLLLSQPMRSLGNHYMTDIVRACWDEYAVCRLAAKYGGDPAETHIGVFLDYLSVTRERANLDIIKHRLHGDHGRLLGEMVNHYGNLMKFASYMLGTLDGTDRDIGNFPELAEALEGNWFHFYLLELRCRLRSI